MPVSARSVTIWCAAVLVAAGCSNAVAGRALRAAPGIDDESRSPVDVETLMLDQSQMRAITGAGDDLTIIPTMDGKVPVDIDQLAKSTPQQCQWIFEETKTFGPDLEEFHKTTFQNPPGGGLISEGAAAYRDPATVSADSELYVRHQRVLPVRVNPVSYDPRSQSLSIAKEIEIEVRFATASVKDGAPRDAEGTNGALKVMLDELAWWGNALHEARAKSPYNPEA